MLQAGPQDGVLRDGGRGHHRGQPGRGHRQLRPGHDGRRPQGAHEPRHRQASQDIGEEQQYVENIIFIEFFNSNILR